MKKLRPWLEFIGGFVVVAGLIWSASQWRAEGAQNTRDIADMKAEQEKYIDTVQRIDGRLNRIEGYIKGRRLGSP